MQIKLKQCDGCNKDRPIWKNYLGKRYCAYCWSYLKSDLTGVKAHTTPKKPIRQVSEKQQKLNVAYGILRRLFLKTNDSCVGCLPGCMHSHGEELTVHHTKGRGKYLLDVSTWIPLCMSCHQWVEEHPEDAKALNLSQSRLSL